MRAQFRSRNKRVDQSHSVLHKWRERSSLSGIHSDHEIDASIFVERQIVPGAGILRSGIFSSRAVGPVNAKADEDAICVEKQLQDSLCSVCVSSARTDLCGGRSAMAVPTATLRSHS